MIRDYIENAVRNYKRIYNISGEKEATRYLNMVKKDAREIYFVTASEFKAYWNETIVALQYEA